MQSALLVLLTLEFESSRHVTAKMNSKIGSLLGLGPPHRSARAHVFTFHCTAVKPIAVQLSGESNAAVVRLIAFQQYISSSCLPKFHHKGAE